MKSFITALQFLTRIHVKEQPDLTVEDFGRSTKFFPLVGVLLGLIYMLVTWCLVAVFGWANFVTTILVLLPVLMTGGLLLDGYMDTADGVFSARSRERKLEIMKDSRVGAFGVIALVSLMMMNWSVLRDIKLVLIMTALFVMPVIGRMAMVMVIAFFPYARPEGMGKAFSDMADKKTVALAAITTLVFVVPWGQAAIAALAAGLGFAWLLGAWLTSKLGGLTGDTYGAVETLTETMVLLVFWVTSWIPGGLHILWR
ncbi:adenosylcobinamide-GDP ribazoletransferase [Selenomonas ruminis]|uniref:Adenosylcobinamide-GDP ribazoletransferase n=1 Tax=Selenomonas ruminis TaxID=2593411 RepID=A0A5D6W2M2_9FIRM|nr:adenosylcobinamide-GDP ribazoletransferase [Selenomonas sp. mPRGC5]TYZ21662.1 adenosylcobinamide-GDP ribazoletransferase [Selenomonas sp. mPRGC5]